MRTIRSKRNLSEKDILWKIYNRLKKQGGKTFLTQEEAAEYLGIQSSYLYKLTHQSEISYFKTGKKNYFKRIDLDRYISRNRIPSHQEIKEGLS